METKYTRVAVISGFTWRPITVVPSVAPNTATTSMYSDASASQHHSAVLLPSINVASSRLPSRRFSLPSPWIWFGNPESLCSVSPQRSGHKRQWQVLHDATVRCSQVRERQKKKDPAYVAATRAGSSAARVAKLTADKLVLLLLSYLDM